MIKDNIFSCDPLHDNSGYTWTIVSRLGDMIDEAEKLYGKRNKDFTILGIEIANIPLPQIYFHKSKHIIIQITKNCINDIGQAIFQSAHEVIHCLCPKPYGTSTYLEEGLATHFSIYYTKKIENPYHVTDFKYSKSYELVDTLLKIDDDIIKRARKIEPDLSKIDRKILSQLNSSLDNNLIDKLTTNFLQEL